MPKPNRQLTRLTREALAVLEMAEHAVWKVRNTMVSPPKRLVSVDSVESKELVVITRNVDDQRDSLLSLMAEYLGVDEDE
jgi:hypothetical protein